MQSRWQHGNRICFDLGVFMGETKAFSKRDLFSGLAVGLLAAWIPIAYSVILPASEEDSVNGVLRELGLNLTVLATFILVISITQRLSRRVGLKERLYSAVGLVLISLLQAFSDYPFFMGMALVLIATILLMFQFLPIFEDFLNYRHVVAIFAFSFPPFILLNLLYRYLLRPTGSRIILSLFLAALAAGAFLLYYISRGQPRPPLVKTRIPMNKRKSLVMLYGFALYCINFVILILILGLIDTAGSPNVTLGVAASLLAVVVFALSMLAITGNLWYISYISFVCFGLGLVFENLVTSSLFQYLPIMLFIAAAGSIIVLFLTYVFHSAQQRDNTLWVGLALVLSYILVTVFVCDLNVGKLLVRYLTGNHVTRFMVSLVFILAPTLFKPFAKRVELDILHPEPAPQPPAESESETKEQDWELARQLYARLTPSEQRIYDLLLKGYQNQQIAETLFISQNTVKFHMKNILAKAEVRNRFMLPGYKSGLCIRDLEESLEKSKNS